MFGCSIICVYVVGWFSRFWWFCGESFGRTVWLRCGGVIMGSVEEKFRRLPSELQREVMDFIDFLLRKVKKKPAKKLRLDWAGGLKEYRDKFTSLELQKKALEWWD